MRRIYVDSSALIKRVSVERHADELRRAMDRAAAAGAVYLASALARVEVGRALRTQLDDESPAVVAGATYEALTGVAWAQLSTPILESARSIGPPFLRSLDAIHLATAVALAVDELWTYDHRLAAAAEELGIPSRSPA